MSDNQALLLKISEVAGKINRHKNQTEQLSAPAYGGSHFPQRASPYPTNQSSRGRGGWIPPHHYQHYHHPRGVAARRARGRASWPGPPVTHHHKTLVINNNKAPDGSAVTPTTNTFASTSHVENMSSNPPGQVLPQGNDSTTQSSEGWVAKRDRHMQLINTAVYDQHAQARARDLEKTRQTQLMRKEEREKQKLRGYLDRSRDTASQVPFDVLVQGERYKVAAGGSKLIKISDGPQNAKSTPKKAVVGGVNFVRSKNGNLWRVGLVKASHKPRHIKKPCKYYSNTGKCKNGMSCLYTHDPNKVAICPRFIQANSCPEGDSCDLSHTPSPHCMPSCVHFLRGNCSNDKCPFTHVKVNPAAPICRPFATLGYCDKGAECTERHVRECPDFDEKGVCTDKTCKLQHVERAGRRRVAAAQAAAAAAKAQGSGNDYNMDSDSDISSGDDGEAIDSDDVDSDTLSEYDYIRRDNQDSEDIGEITMQEDFIHLPRS
ncbi:unnamed protein product [Tuber melanosporum]|uniref:(Perigord truffle) hypothetical protein n=1 Tax=Tuber melanosporum (strain Mel28) TaxID=656061 RepID=D5GBD4_TUBMM|nr:uncharacterized protein GSTUM_00000472001 [Tuber melanosporum]CAZ81827.1 unnamed protein product [Tuber melanosporum]